MTPEQIEKLVGILTREKTKLAEIEKKYEEKKRTIKEKYVKRRQAMGYNKQMDELEQKEAVHREKEIEEADSLIENL